MWKYVCNKDVPISIESRKQKDEKHIYIYIIVKINDLAMVS